MDITGFDKVTYRRGRRQDGTLTKLYIGESTGWFGIGKDLCSRYNIISYKRADIFIKKSDSFYTILLHFSNNGQYKVIEHYGNTSIGLSCRSAVKKYTNLGGSYNLIESELAGEELYLKFEKIK